MFGSAAFRLIRTGKWLTIPTGWRTFLQCVRRCRNARPGTHAETMHTGIQFHPDRYWSPPAPPLRGGKPSCFARCAHLRGNGRQIGGVENLQQQDGLSRPLADVEPLQDAPRQSVISGKVRVRSPEDRVHKRSLSPPQIQRIGRRQFTQTLQVVRRARRLMTNRRRRI